MMKRVLKILALLLILGGAAMYYFKNTSTVTAWLMLFNQNSTQSIVGWLNKAESSALSTVLLSMFQSFALPFKTSPRIVMAAVAVFGFFKAWILVVLGRLAAIALWFFIGWLLVGIRPKKDRGLCLLYGGVSCFLVPYAAPLALLWGALGQKLWKLLLLALPVQLMHLGFYGKYASIYSSIIPDWCGYALYALGVLMIAAALFVGRKLSKRS